MTTRIADIARDDDGNAVAGATVSLRRESDNFQLDSTTTDANGYFTFSATEVLYPGPVKVVVTDTNGNVRQHSGRSTGQVGTVFMSDFPHAFLMMTDGVVGGASDELEVSSTGLTMNVSVAAGEAFLFGHSSVWEAAQDVAITSNGTGNPRLDLIVVRLIPPGVSEEGKQVIVAVAGTAAASPVAPTETQDPNTVWEIPLATVRVESGASSIAADKVTDARVYTSGPLQDNSVGTAKLVDDSVTQPKIADGAVGVDQMTTGADVSTLDTAKVLKAPTSGTEPIFQQLAINELSDVTVSTTPLDTQVMSWSTTNNRWEPRTLSASTADVASAVAVSVDSEVVIFSGTTGKAIKRSALSAGVVKATAGVLSAAAASDLPTAIDAAKIADGTVSNAEFQYLNGVTSNVQDQIDAVSGGGTGDVVGPASAVDSQAVVFNSTTGKLVKASTLTASLVKSTSGVLSAAAASDLPSAISATKIGDGSVSTTEFQYINTLTSNAQTQLNAKSSTSHVHQMTDPTFDQAVAGYSFHAVDTTVVTVASKNTGTLASGKRYFVFARADMQASAPAGGYIDAYVRITAAGSNTIGTRQGTESGERSIWAQDAAIVTGTGASINVAARSASTLSGGSVSDASVYYLCIPLDIPAS